MRAVSVTLGDLVGTREAARLLGVDVSTLRRWAQDGKVEATQVGRRWRFHRQALSRARTLVGGEAAATREAALAEPSQAFDFLGTVLRSLPESSRRRIREVANQQERAFPAAAPAAGVPGAALLFALLLVEEGSTVHLDPTNDSTLVRFRVLGTLQSLAEVPHGDPCIHRVREALEALAGLTPADDFYATPDRSGTITHEGRQVGFRLSESPSTRGTVTSLHLFDSRPFTVGLEQRLGIPGHLHPLLGPLLPDARGLVLLTGNCFEERMHAAYRVLARWASPATRVVSVEEPHHLAVDGVQQLHLWHRWGKSPTGMATSLLRQHPDAMMVSSFRQLEDLDHLVETATRMPILLCPRAGGGHELLGELAAALRDPTALTRALEVVLWCHEFPRLCDHCRGPVKEPPLAREIEDFLGGLPATLFEAPGCDRCYGTGRRGTAAVGAVLSGDEARDALERARLADPAANAAADRAALAAPARARLEGGDIELASLVELVGQA